MTHPGKERFSDRLWEGLKRAGVTQQEAASVLRIPAATFRTRLARNTFTEAEGKKLMAAIDMPPPSKATTYFGRRWVVADAAPIDGRPLAQVIREVDRQRRAVDLRLDQLAVRLTELVRAMRRRERPHPGVDLLVVATSTVTPVEFESDADEELISAIGTAVKNGGMFVYIRPDESYLTAFVDKWKFTRVPGYTDILQEVDWFRSRVRTNLEQVHSQSGRKAKQLTDEQIIQIHVSESPFWAAGIGIGMFHTNELDGSVLRRMTVRLPGTHRRALIQPGDYDTFAARFTRFAGHSLRWVLEHPSTQPTPPNTAAVSAAIAALAQGGM